MNEQQTKVSQPSNRLSADRHPKKPTDAAKANAVIGKELVLSADESRSDAALLLSEDFDQQIISAVHMGQAGIIGLNAEHPTATVFRVGIDSIRAGKTSQLFLDILKLIGQAADDGQLDVLKEIAQTPYKGIELKSNIAAKRDKHIADEFKKVVIKGVQEGKTYSEIKVNPYHGFLKLMSDKGIDVKVVERALAKHGVNWPAKNPGRPRN